jgi:hypothetical protein
MFLSSEVRKKAVPGLEAYLDHGPVALYSMLDDIIFFLSEVGLHRIRFIHTESHTEHFRKDIMVPALYSRLSFCNTDECTTKELPIHQKSQSKHQIKNISLYNTSLSTPFLALHGRNDLEKCRGCVPA